MSKDYQEALLPALFRLILVAPPPCEADALSPLVSGAVWVPGYAESPVGAKILQGFQRSVHLMTPLTDEEFQRSHRWILTQLGSESRNAPPATYAMETVLQM